MRKLIAGMQVSLDGKVEGPDGYADWVETWSDSYDVMARVDACLLGSGMYPGYEARMTKRAGHAPPATTKPEEVEYARFAVKTPHYVLSSTLTAALWPKTRFVRGLEHRP